MPEKLYVPEVHYVQGESDLKIDMAYGPFTLDRLMKFIAETFEEKHGYKKPCYKQIRIRLSK